MEVENTDMEPAEGATERAPDAIYGEHWAHSGGDDAVRCAATRPSQPNAICGVAALPPGCAVGMPVFAGIPAVCLRVNRVKIMQLAMRYVEGDDYHSLMELARCGLVDCFDERRFCGFTCSLKAGVEVTKARFAGQPIAPGSAPTLEICKANLLHYASCVGAFRAATALLIVCPSLLQTQCKVSLCSETGQVCTVKWGVTDITGFFCDLYSSSPDGEQDHLQDQGVVEMSTMFLRAHSVFQLVGARPASLPFLALPTVSERIAATVGVAPDYMVAAFCAAAGVGFHSNPEAIDASSPVQS